MAPALRTGLCSRAGLGTPYTLAPQLSPATRWAPALLLCGSHVQLRDSSAPALTLVSLVSCSHLPRRAPRAPRGSDPSVPTACTLICGDAGEGLTFLRFAG